MIKNIAIAVALVVLGLLIFISTRPDTYVVQRTASIQAPAAKVYPLVSDFHFWATWSPWEELDPQLKRTYSGAIAGKGSIYEWVGNAEVGQGRMEITEAQPPERIAIDLDFIKPFASPDNLTEFLFVRNGAATDVTWKMTGKNNFMGKAFGLFMNMDAMVGKDFEKGLSKLKAAAEKSVVSATK